MKLLRFFSAIVLLAATGLISCASATHQTDAILQSRMNSPITAPNLPTAHVIEKVPFVDQAAGQCGPATLAMSWAGKSVPIEKLVSQVYTPGMKGSLQNDMIGTTRRNGLMAIPISGMSELLEEVAAGHPVIVFENLALKWIPNWHYAVVYGYDLGREIVYMHSGPEEAKLWDLRKFERSWKLGDYWGLVVLPAGRLSATGSELTHSNAASALENLGFNAEAETSYRAILRRWPKSLTAQIGLANLAFDKKDFNGAIDYLKDAVRVHPQSAPAWHNLALAQRAARKRMPAVRSAQRAMELVPDDARDQYRQNLSEILVINSL